MKITGQILKENRERKGVTLNEVSLATKITTKTLISIESGDPVTLPPKTFLRGFVRSYAIYLGLDVEEILRTFQEEMGSTLSRPVPSGPNPAELNAAATEMIASGKIDTSNNSTPVVKPQESSRPERRAKKIDAEEQLRDEPSLVTKGGIVAGILLLIVLIVFLKSKMDSYEAERTSGPTDPSSVETAAPSSALPAETADTSIDETEDSEELKSSTEPKTSPTAAGPASSPSPTASPKPSPSATPTATPKPSPSPSPSPTATPTPKPSPSATPTATPKPSPSPSPTPTPAPAAVKTNEILIEALDQVDVEVTIDGEASRTLKLRAEQVQAIKSQKKAILKFSNGGSVNLIVNGVDRGVPGDLGKPARVELP